MKNRFTKMALSIATMLLSSSLAFAADVTVKTPDVKGAAKATADSAKSGAKGVVTDTKAAAKTKIVAGRPFANKAQLKSRKIVPDTVYEKVTDLIIAKKLKK